MNDIISLRSSKNPSFVTIKQKVNFTNESIIHANTEKYTKFCAIKATNHQSLVSREFIKKDFLIKNYIFDHFLYKLRANFSKVKIQLGPILVSENK